MESFPASLSLRISYQHAIISIWVYPSTGVKVFYFTDKHTVSGWFLPFSKLVYVCAMSTFSGWSCKPVLVWGDCIMIYWQSSLSYSYSPDACWVSLQPARVSGCCLDLIKGKRDTVPRAHKLHDILGKMLIRMASDGIASFYGAGVGVKRLRLYLLAES